MILWNESSRNAVIAIIVGSGHSVSTFERISELTKMTGVSAPDFPLTDLNGKEVHLSTYWKDHPVLIVFLRHYGCTFCRELATHVRDSYSDIQGLNINVVGVGQADYKTGKAFSIFLNLPYPLVVCGDDLSVYRAYGLERGTFGQLFGLRSVAAGIRSLLRGHPQGKVVGNGHQMPGIFLVDTGGVIRYAYQHRHAGDNPKMSALLENIRQIMRPAAESTPLHAGHAG